VPARVRLILAAGGAALLVAAGVLLLTRGGPGGGKPDDQAVAATQSRPASAAATAGSAAAASKAASPVPSARASSAAPAGHASPLGTAAASYAAGRTGTVTAAVLDLRTGQTWSLGQPGPQDEASVVKLNVLEALLAQKGKSGTGLSAADRDLATQMIEDSDNDAATSLWDEVGGASGIRSFNTAAGLADTTPSSCVTCAGFPWPGWGLSKTTPADQLALLRTIARPNSLLTDAERAYALSLMENVTADQRWGVSGGVSAQATVALKNGWLPLDSAQRDWQVNSVGYVSGSGRDYLIAVLSTGNPTEQYGIDTINQLAAMVWAALG
jgi:hypothetical protein